MRNFFTSDEHFGHQHLLQFQRKEFKLVAEMDEALIAAWQTVVDKKDMVYILGDLSFRKPVDTIAILDRLPGRKVLVLGNHDKSVNKPAVRKYFERIEDVLEVKIQDADAYEGRQRIVMCHYPMISWNASRYGSWMFHGHCHANLQSDKLPQAKRLDVGVDMAFKLGLGYRPFSYEEAKQLMELQKMDAVDHHRPKDWKNEEPQPHP